MKTVTGVIKFEVPVDVHDDESAIEEIKMLVVNDLLEFNGATFEFSVE
jgi:hypothetical protein